MGRSGLRAAAADATNAATPTSESVSGTERDPFDGPEFLFPSWRHSRILGAFGI